MATIEANITRRRRVGPPGTRHLWLAYLLAFAIMFYGFSPNLYGGFGPLDPLRIVHGLLAAGWMALLVAQSWLIGRGHWKLHGRFGRASRYVTPVLVGSAFLVVIDMLGPRGHFPRELRLALAWSDIWSLVLFSGLYIAAIAWRRNLAIHARCMAGTVFVVLPPALGRAYGPIFHGLRPSLTPSFATVEIALFALILWDASRGKFLLPLPTTLAGILFVHLTMFPAANWPPFVALAQMLGLPPGL